MESNLHSVEAETINQWIKDATNITVYLKNGIGLKGKITQFDEETVTLYNGSVVNNIQKRGISTIGPDIRPHSNKYK